MMIETYMIIRFFYVFKNNVRSTAIDLVFLIAPFTDIRRLKFRPEFAEGRFSKLVRNGKAFIKCSSKYCCT